MVSYTLFLAVLITQLISLGAALNILAIVTLPLKSHYFAFQNLFRELSLNGHTVTVLNNYPDKNPPKNLSFVKLDPIPPSSFPPLSKFENFSYFHHLLNFIYHFWLSPKRIEEDCEKFLVNDNVKAFRERGDKFDVIFVEQFLSDCGLVYAAVMYDAPIIGITSHALLPWAYPRLGLPFDFGSDAFFFSEAGTNPPIYNKFVNFVMNSYMNTIGRWQFQRRIYNVFDQYLPNFKLDVEKIARERIKMMFSNQHYSVTGARLLAPQVLEIGGIHVGKSKPVPEVDLSMNLDKTKIMSKVHVVPTNQPRGVRQRDGISPKHFNAALKEDLPINFHV